MKKVLQLFGLLFQTVDFFILKQCRNLFYVILRKGRKRMIYTATTLKKSIYSVLDSVLDSGIPAVIVPEEPVGRLDRLVPHQIVQGNSEDLVDLNWDGAWTGKDFPE